MSNLENVRIGWLYADKEEITILKKMGVFGLMNWSPSDGPIHKALGKSGSLEYCLCSEETHQKLQEYYRELWRTKYPHYASLSNRSKAYPDWSKVTKREAEEYMTKWGCNSEG